MERQTLQAYTNVKYTLQFALFKYKERYKSVGYLIDN